MGSNSSKEETENLVENEGEIQLVSQELRLVLIGGQGAGKNTIGNGILGKKVFTFWTSMSMRQTRYISKTHTVSGKQIHLTRITGWRGDLSGSEKTKSEIVRCVHTLNSTGLHAVLLALKVNSVLSESTISTLEDLQLWDHTIVVFTHADKLGNHTIEDYIIHKQLQTLIDKCGGRYYVFQKNDSNQINKIEEHVFDKISANVEKLLKSKGAEIKTLNNIIEDQEGKIKTLIQLRAQDRDTIKKLQHQLTITKKELKTKMSEKEELIKRVINVAQNARDSKTEIEDHHAAFCSQRSQNVTQMSMRSNTQIPLHDLSSNGSDLPRWGVTLFKILVELSNDQLKKFTDLMHLEWEISRSLMEGKSRGDLPDLIIQMWGDKQSVLKTRDLMKMIPRNDNTMKKLFKPYLDEIGETWDSS